MGDDLRGNVVEISQKKKEYIKQIPKWKFWKKKKNVSKHKTPEIVPKMASGIMIDTIPNVIGLSNRLGLITGSDLSPETSATGLIRDNIVCDDTVEVLTPKRRKRRVRSSDSGISTSSNETLSESNGRRRSPDTLLEIPQFNFNAVRQNSIVGIISIPFIPLMAVFYVLYILLMLPFIILNNALKPKFPHVRKKRRL